MPIFVNTPNILPRFLMDAFLVVLGVAVLCTFYLAGYSIYTVLKLEKKFSDLNLRAIRTADYVVDLQGKTKKCLQDFCFL